MDEDAPPPVPIRQARPIPVEAVARRRLGDLVSSIASRNEVVAQRESMTIIHRAFPAANASRVYSAFGPVFRQFACSELLPLVEGLPNAAAYDATRLDHLYLQCHASATRLLLTLLAQNLPPVFTTVLDNVMYRYEREGRDCEEVLQSWYSRLSSDDARLFRLSLKRDPDEIAELGAFSQSVADLTERIETLRWSLLSTLDQALGKH